jgi:hypothetical protein
MQRIIRFATLDSLLDFVFLKKLLRSSYQIDNLLSVKKNRLCGAVIFLGSKEFAARRTKVTGLEERSHQNLFFQFSLNWRILQDSTPLISYQWLPPVAIRRVFPGWIQVIVTGTGVVVGLNGEFVHIVQLGANHLSGTQLHGKE